MHAPQIPAVKKLRVSRRNFMQVNLVVHQTEVLTHDCQAPQPILQGTWTDQSRRTLPANLLRQHTALVVLHRTLVRVYTTAISDAKR